MPRTNDRVSQLVTPLKPYEAMAMEKAVIVSGVGALTSFDLGPGAVEQIASDLNSWLALPADERAAASASMAATVRARWSWESVGRTVVTASEGDLGDLVPVS